MSRLKVCPVCQNPCKKTCKDCDITWSSKSIPHNEKHYLITYSENSKTYTSKRIERTVVLSKELEDDWLDFIWVNLNELSKNFSHNITRYLCTSALWDDILCHHLSGKNILDIPIVIVEHLPDKYGIAVDCLGEIGYLKLEQL